MMIEEDNNIFSGPEQLKAYEDNWQTSMGAWFPGERVVLRGKDVFSELNDHSWMEYLIYAVTGRYSSKLAEVIEGLWTLSTSFPDPRLWNNRIAALAGTARSTGVLAISAGTATSEATVYGLRPIKGALDFLYRAEAKKREGLSIESIVKEELKAYRSVSGFGRPLTNRDERITPVLDFLKTMGSEQGKFVLLAFEIENYFKHSRYKYSMNIAALNAAVAADFGLTTSEYYHLTTMAFTGGMFPCYIDSRNQAQGLFFPLSVERVKSAPCPTRKWI